MEFLRILLAQIFAMLLGLAIVFLFFKEDAKLASIERLVLSYVIGMGIIPLYMMMLYLCGFGFAIIFIYLPLSIFIVMMLIYRRKSLFYNSLNIGKVKRSLIDFLLICGITFEIFHSFFRALIRPIESFDSVASFAIKAKIFYLARGIPQDFFSNIAQNFPHPRYPLMVPLQEAFGFISMGSFNDQLVKIIFPLHFAALLFLFYFGLKNIVGKRLGLIFTFLMASLNELSRFSATGYTDIHFALYFSIGFIYWYRFILIGNKREIPFIFITGLFSAFALFTKDIGIAIPVLYLGLMLIHASNTKAFKLNFTLYTRYLLVLTLFILPWLLVRLNLGVGQKFINSDILSIKYVTENFLTRTIPILYEFQTNVFNPKKWNILWPIFIVVFAVNYRASVETNLKYVTVLIASVFIMYFLYYVAVSPIAYGTGKTYAQSLRAGMNRHMIYIVPFVMLWLAYAFKKIKDP